MEEKMRIHMMFDNMIEDVNYIKLATYFRDIYK